MSCFDLEGLKGCFALASAFLAFRMSAFVFLVTFSTPRSVTRTSMLNN